MVLAQSMGRLQIMLSKWKCLMAKLSFFGWCWKTNFAVFHVLSPPGQIAVCDFEGCLCSLNFSLSHILLRCHSDGSNSTFFCFVFEGNAISEDRLCTDLRSTNLIPITKENICFPHSWAPAPTALLRRYFNSAVTPGENLANCHSRDILESQRRVTARQTPTESEIWTTGSIPVVQILVIAEVESFTSFYIKPKHNMCSPNK